MDTLAQLFGSEIRVSLMRLFLGNPEESFSLGEIATRLKTNRNKFLPQLKFFEKIGFIKSAGKKTDITILKSGKTKKEKSSAFKLNGVFPFVHQLQNLILKTTPITPEGILSKLKKGGNLKLLILAGQFVESPEHSAGIDILAVGDKINKKKIEKAVSEIEAKLTKEITYTIFSTNEFWYRWNMHDRFLRDIFEIPHIKVLDKIGI